jgi:hypothetical protein
MSIEQFFILGNPRSGTSLLRLMLNNHSEISVPPECGFLLWLEPKYKNWNANCINSKQQQKFIKDLKNSKKFETWRLDDEFLLCTINKFQPKNYSELAKCVYLSYAFSLNKSPLYVGDKNNYYINHLKKINTLFHNSLAIHIVRDGRDVVTSYRGIKNIPNSFKYKPKLPYHIKEIAIEWNKNNLNIFNFYKEKENYIVIKYEDLLLNSKDILTQILSMFNLRFEPKMIDFYKDNLKNQTEPKETLAWKQKTLQPIDKSNIGKYKQELTNIEIEEFNILAQESLKLFGYVT